MADTSDKELIVDLGEDDEYDDSHTSDVVFPELADHVRPKSIEWMEEPSTILLACGHRVEIFPGDTMWVIPFPDGKHRPIAVDPVTIH